MSKGQEKQQDIGSLGQTTVPETENQQDLPRAEGADPSRAETGQEEQSPRERTGTGKPKKKPNKESKVHRLTQGKGFYTPKKRERKAPALLTVDQYLRKASHDEAVSGLVRSLFRKKIQGFSEWEREVAALLKKQTS